MENTNKPLRQVVVLRQVRIPWGALQKGDVFRTLKASPGDVHAEDDQWNLATSDCKEEPGPATWGIQMVDIYLTATSELRTLKVITEPTRLSFLRMGVLV